jgi:hypothetical protein
MFNRVFLCHKWQRVLHLSEVMHTMHIFRQLRSMPYGRYASERQMSSSLLRGVCEYNDPHVRKTRTTLSWMIASFLFHRYYNDVGVCARCSPNCKTCIGQGKFECVTCEDGLKLSKGGTCVSSNYTASKPASNLNKQCSDGYWYNRISRKCQPCDPSCSKCNG